MKRENFNRSLSVVIKVETEYAKLTLTRLKMIQITRKKLLNFSGIRVPSRPDILIPLCVYK